MGQQSKIRTARQVDDPVQLTASYRMSALDRALLDEEIRATQQHLVDSLINGLVATWSILDTSSISVAAGDVVASASSALGTVTRVTSSVLTSAGMGAGLVLRAATPGSPVWLAQFGRVLQSSAITGLASGSAGAVRINATTGRLERVASLGSSDYPAGFVDAVGNLQLAFMPTGIVGTGGGGGGGGVSWQDGTDAAYTITWTSGKSETKVTIPALTASRTWKFPAAPSDGDVVTLADLLGHYVTAAGSGFAIAMQGNAGTEHVFAEGADKGTSYSVPAALLGDGALSFTYRASNTSWNLA